MPAAAITQTWNSRAIFPAAEVRRRLQDEVLRAAKESAVLRGGWEPVLDSLRMVSVVIALEDLLRVRIQPEKVVRHGGYASAEEAVDDIFERLERHWSAEINRTKRGEADEQEQGKADRNQ